MTANPSNSGRTLYFVDANGGMLSLFATGVACSLGFNAVATTCTPPTEVPGEAATVLEEVGMRLPDGGAEPFDLKNATGCEVVFLGPVLPLGFPELPIWNVMFFVGGGELERLSLARMARDKIERELERARSRG